MTKVLEHLQGLNKGYKISLVLAGMLVGCYRHYLRMVVLEERVGIGNDRSFFVGCGFAFNRSLDTRSYGIVRIFMESYNRNIVAKDTLGRMIHSAPTSESANLVKQ